jgi:DNA-binding HxlR family transcriptional regulator
MFRFTFFKGGSGVRISDIGYLKNPSLFSNSLGNGEQLIAVLVRDETYSTGQKQIRLISRGHLLPFSNQLPVRYLKGFQMISKSIRHETCPFKLRASRDALEVIQGKWRIPIIVSLTYGNKRFGEIRKDIADISPKILSQELKKLEANRIISRTIYDSMPVTVEYALTPLVFSMKGMLEEVMKWGIHFRQEILEK